MADNAREMVASGNPHPACFRLVGDVWQVSYAGDTAYVRDAKGMRCLQYLLMRPHVSVDVRLLMSGPAAAGTPPETDPDALQRARSAVSKRIHAAVRRITAHHLMLGRHLDACVHTGAQCRYSPDPREPQEWSV